MVDPEPLTMGKKREDHLSTIGVFLEINSQSGPLRNLTMTFDELSFYIAMA